MHGRSWRILLVALLAAVAAGVWWWGSRDAFVRPVQDGDGRGTLAEWSDDPEARSAMAGGARATERAAGDPARRAVTDSGAGSEVRSVLLHGRAVDEDGNALAGVRAELHGLDREGSGPAVTAADGHFALRFAPRPTGRVTLELEGVGRVAVRGSWFSRDLAPVVDVGDVVLPVGCRVRGRLVDEAGAVVRPREEPRALHFEFVGDVTAGALGPRDRFRVDVGDDGRFASPRRVPAGHWTVRGRGLLLPHDQSFELREPEEVIAVVVVPPEQVPAIRGEVVDAAGRPVAGATIDPPPERRTNRSWSVNSDPDGSFVMPAWRGADTDEPMVLSARARGYEAARTTEPVRWGATGVRLVMQRARELEIRVQRQDDGRPVEAFGVRVMPAGRAHLRGSFEREVRGGWQHDGGVLRIAGIRAGERTVYVAPRSSTGLACASRTITVHEEQPLPALTFRLPALVEQRVRLRTADGLPIARSEVQLIDAGGAAIDATTWVRDFDSQSYSNRETGWLVDEARTGEDGTAVLSGAANRPYTIRCLGEHLPVVVAGVKLQSELLELTAGRGATVRVRLEPAAVVARWRQLLGLPAAGAPAAGQRHRAPAIHLSRRVAGRAERHPDRGPGMTEVLVRDDGSAVLEGVAAGIWNLRAERPAGMAADSRRELSTVTLGTVDVPESGSVDAVFDVSEHAFGRLRGQVLRDDVPLTRGTVSLFRTLSGSGADGEPSRDKAWSHVDGQGCVDISLPVGGWTAWVRREDERQGISVFRVAGEVVVCAGETADVTLHVRSARAIVRTVDAAGEPVAGVRLRLDNVDDGSRAYASGLATDADGRTTLLGGAGVYRLRSRIRSLNDPQAYNDFVRGLQDEHDNDFGRIRPLLDATLVELGTLTLPAADGSVTTVTLPAAWDR